MLDFKNAALKCGLLSMQLTGLLSWLTSKNGHRRKVWAGSTLTSKNWNFKRLNYCIIIETISLLGRNLGAINMDLPCQLFPQSTVVLLSACKLDEGKDQTEAHVKGRSHQSDLSPSPPPQGKSSQLGAQPWMCSLLIRLVSWTYRVYLDIQLCFQRKC